MTLAGAGNVMPRAIPYRFVDTVRQSAPEPCAELVAEAGLLGRIDPETLERDVRTLASVEMEGRARGSRGNALARAYIISRLRGAGLAPLFAGGFEQPTFPKGDGGEAYAVNVGAFLAAPDPEAGWIALVAHYDHLGVRRGKTYPGADDNASAVAMLLALADGLGRARPPLRCHVALVFPDAEEPPDIRTQRMGSTWFWRHPPFPMAKLHCALVFEMMGQTASRATREAGMANAVFVLGAEGSPGLARLARGIPPEPGVDPMPLGLPLIEAYPFVPSRRFARSDYHGLREHGRRPFLLVTSGRAPTYHTPDDTPDTLDYLRLGRSTRWVGRLLVHAAEGPEELGWTDLVADPVADAHTLLHLSATAGDGTQFPWLLRRAIGADRARVQELLRMWEAGRQPAAAEYRFLQLASLRLQAAVWHPPGWWFALW